jgi:hypothetical protein
MGEHRSSRLKLFGGPEVDQLINGRYRVTARVLHTDKTEVWYYANIGNTFGAFATAMDDEINVDGTSEGWDSPDGAAYLNTQLIDMRLGYTPSGKYIATFVYETLTGTWIGSEADVVGSTENGLRTLTQTQVAKTGTALPYDEDDVGVSTITSGGKTLYLAGIENASDERMGQVVLRWAEAGVLSESEYNLSEGVIEAKKVFLANEASFNGPITSRTIGNFDGLRTITVSRLQDASGNSIVNGNTNLVHQFETFSNFAYPGVMSLNDESPESNIKRFSISIDRPPVPCVVKSTVYVFFQTSNTLAREDYTYDSSAGLWSPNNWASFIVDAISSSYDTTIFDTEGLRGYRSSSTSTSGTVLPSGFSSVTFEWQGEQIRGTVSIDYDITIDQGPPNPIGSKWVLSLGLDPAFDDIDGNTYYKKTIVVSEAIPAQVSGEVPYD